MGEISFNIGKVIDEILPESIISVLDEIGEEIKAEARENISAKKDRTGQLKRSIDHKVTAEKETYTLTLGSNAPYAPYVHEGTGLYAVEGNGRKDVPWTYYDMFEGKYYKTDGQKPTPFLRDAIEDNKDKILNKFEGGLENDRGNE